MIAPAARVPHQVMDPVDEATVTSKREEATLQVSVNTLRYKHNLTSALHQGQ